MKIVNNSLLFGTFLLLAFPLFYFVYKFGDPEPLYHDYFQYYWLYKEFDSDKVIAPHNMRLVGAFFVYLFYKLNIFYDTFSAADKYQTWGFLKQVYFDALLFNYLSVAVTCLVLFKLLNKHLKDYALSFIGALLYLLGFGTIFYELMPGTDAFSILLFVLILNGYIEQKVLVLIPLALLIFQREYLLIVFATLAFLDFWKDRQAYFLKIGIAASLFFVIHFILRKTIFYTPHLDFQSSGNYFLNNLMHVNYSMASYFKQVLLTLNLFLIYLGLLLYKKWRGLYINRFNAWVLVILFIQINLISHVAGHGNNCGRYFYMLSPLIIFYLMKELKHLNLNTFKMLSENQKSSND